MIRQSHLGPQLLQYIIITVVTRIRISLIFQNRWRKRHANYFVRWKIISKRKGLRAARTLLVSQISRLIFRFQTAAPGSSRAVSRRWITKLKGFLAIPTARPNSRSFPWETDDENGRMFVAYCPAFRHAYETSASCIIKGRNAHG